VGINQRKRITRATPSSMKITIEVSKPRNTVIRAASLRQVKLATVKHHQTKSAVRHAEKEALRKVLDAALKD
jgi:hypothetical protein